MWQWKSPLPKLGTHGVGWALSLRARWRRNQRPLRLQGDQEGQKGYLVLRIRPESAEGELDTAAVKVSLMQGADVTCVRNPRAGCDPPPRGVRLGNSPTSSSGKQNKRHEVNERATQNEAEPGSHFAA